MTEEWNLLAASRGTSQTSYRILKNEKYMGNQTWGKTHKYRVCSPENLDQKTINAFSALITHDQFAKSTKGDTINGQIGQRHQTNC